MMACEAIAGVFRAGDRTDMEWGGDFWRACVSGATAYLAQLTWGWSLCAYEVLTDALPERSECMERGTSCVRSC